MILKEEAHRLGMDAVSWVFKPPVAFEDRKIATFDSYAPEWRARYFENNYLTCDPTVKHGLTSVRPFLWSETKALAPEFWEDADSFGLLWSNLPGHLNRWKIHQSRRNTWQDSVKRSTPA